MVRDSTTNIHTIPPNPVTSAPTLQSHGIHQLHFHSPLVFCPAPRAWGSPLSTDGKSHGDGDLLLVSSDHMRFHSLTHTTVLLLVGWNIGEDETLASGASLPQVGSGMN